MNIFLMNLNEIFMWVVQASLYAVAVIAVIVFVQSLTRSVLAAKWIYALWIVLLLRLVIPAGLESGWSLWNLTPLHWMQQMFQPAAEVSAKLVTFAPSATESDAALLPAKEFFSWQTLRIFLPGIWLTGALLLMCGIIIGNLRLWNTVRRLPFVTDHALLELFEECRQSMRIQTVVGLIVTDRVKSPILFGFVRPRVLLPSDLARELPPEHLRYILLHEFAHLKRRDILTGWILAFLQALHWFNPMVWWAFTRMRFDRELACDEQVLSRVHEAERRHYGDVLIGMLERFNHNYQLPAIAGILENKDQLKRRLVMIKKFRRPTRRGIIVFTSLLAVLSIALLTEPQALLSQQSADVQENTRKSRTMFLLSSQSDKQSADAQEVIANDPGTQYPLHTGAPYQLQTLNENENGVTPPEVLAAPMPWYTDEARKARIEGIIVLQVTISKDGMVDNVEVIESLGYGLDEAVIETIMADWRFNPATSDKEPIDHSAVIKIEFKLL